MTGRAPPHDEPCAQKQASERSGNASDHAAQRSRLAGTGVYKAVGDTGSSSRVSAPYATAPLVLGKNGNGKR